MNLCKHEYCSVDLDEPGVPAWAWRDEETEQVLGPFCSEKCADSAGASFRATRVAEAVAHITGQKYHHGDCTAHCRCAREAAAAGLRCDVCGHEETPPFAAFDGCQLCGSGVLRPVNGEAAKPARRFCACGQELMGARLEFAYLSPVCGDCAASKGPGVPSLDTRIAAARAVTDETEGAWDSTHWSEP